MTGIKPSTHGIVVDHKESGVRYAVSDKNYNEKIHRKVRDLKPGETVRAFQPLRREALGGGSESPEATGTPGDPAKPVSESSEGLTGTSGHTKTEGAAPVASQDKKEGN